MATETQAAALLPAFAADLNHADGWHAYVISATLDPNTRTIAGTEDVVVRNGTPQALDDVCFHLYPNHPDFDGGSLWVSDTVMVDGKPVAVTTEQQDVLLRVPLPAPLPPGAATTISLSFRAHTPQNHSASGYGAFNMEAGVWAMASFYPVLARLTDDGWDCQDWISNNGDLSVTDTALYDVILQAPDGWTLVSTGVELPDMLPSPRGMHTAHMVSGPQRDFFVAAVNGLEQATELVDGTRITVYYQAGQSAAGLRSLRVAAQALHTFNTWYGPYPYTELELIETALTYFYGVEYPGVLLLDQQLYWKNGSSLETYIAHEVSHQWWYNVVGTDAQGEPWIDEGLASYSEIVYYEAQGDEESAQDEQDWFRDEAEGETGAFNRPAASYQGDYFTLVYAKSAMFFSALRAQMGDEAFFQFLNTFYQTYRYRMADGDDMIAVAEETCVCGVPQLYAEWTGGAPR